MRFLIVGSSPLAAWLAAQARALGQPIAWLADTFYADAIHRAGGIRMYQNGTSQLVPNVAVMTTFETAFAEPYDAVLFAMPGYDVTSALFDIQKYHIKPPPIVSLQHGVGGYERIESIHHAKAVRAAISLTVVHPVAGSTSVPEIVVRGTGGIGLDITHPLSESIAAFLRSLGLPVILNNGRDLAWSALFWQIYANAVPTLLDMPFDEIRQNLTLFTIEYRQMREALSIIEALGVRLIDLPGAPVNALATQLQLWPSEWLPNRLITPAEYPTLRYELLTRIPHSEAAYLNGAVAIRAYDLKLNAPINHALALTVQDVAEGRALWSQFRRDPRMLEALIGVAAGRQ